MDARWLTARHAYSARRGAVPKSMACRVLHDAELEYQHDDRQRCSQPS
jgi:hypothetical protein